MDKQWLETQFCLNPEKTKAALAKALNLEPPAISKMLSGTRQIKAAEYVGMRKFFGMTTESGQAKPYLERAYQVKPLQTQAQALYDSRADGGVKEAEAQDAWVMPASFFEKRTQAPAEKIRFFEVKDKAMMPDIDAGDHVLVDLSDKKPSPAGLFVLYDGIGTVIRQCEFIPQSDPLKLRISAHNSQFRSYQVEFDKTEILGRVIARMKWL